jgi:hypothetical protein
MTTPTIVQRAGEALYPFSRPPAASSARWNWSGPPAGWSSPTCPGPSSTTALAGTVDCWPEARRPPTSPIRSGYARPSSGRRPAASPSRTIVHRPRQIGARRGPESGRGSLVSGCAPWAPWSPRRQGPEVREQPAAGPVADALGGRSAGRPERLRRAPAVPGRQRRGRDDAGAAGRRTTGCGAQEEVPDVRVDDRDRPTVSGPLKRGWNRAYPARLALRSGSESPPARARVIMARTAGASRRCATSRSPLLENPPRRSRRCIRRRDRASSGPRNGRHRERPSRSPGVAS